MIFEDTTAALPPTADVDLTRSRVVIAGAGVTGRSLVAVLRERAGDLTVVDAAAADPGRREALTGTFGDDVPVSAPDPARWEHGVRPDLVVVSPGWRLDDPYLQAAVAAGAAVWGDLDLAWVLQAQGRRPDAVWLPLTGTNGKSTTVRMLESMLRATGRTAMAVGNIGVPVVDAVCAEDPPELLALEVSALQLARSTVMRPWSSAVLNLAPDHLDWFGTYERYHAAKARVHARTVFARLYNVEDEATKRMVREVPAVDGGRVVGVTAGSPGPGMLGVVEDLLVDRAFVDEPERAEELATFADIVPFAPHNVTNALFAAGLARSAGATPAQVREGLRTFRPEPHRIAEVAMIGGVRFVDDSKATNPHAAQASLSAFGPVVWIAGGLAKGVRFDDLVRAVADRLVGVVLLGQDRAAVAEALARHAPEVPVVDADAPDTSPMDLMRHVVSQAFTLAPPGSTVLLAPACASMDRFRDYHHRGEAFAAAVRERAEGGV